LNSTIASTSSIDDIYAELTPPTRLETALTFAGTVHGHTRTSPTRPGRVFGKQNLFSPRKERSSSANAKPLDESDILTVDKIPPGLSTGSGIVSSLFGSPTLLSTPKKRISSPSAMPFGDSETRSTSGTSRVSNMPIQEFLQIPSDSDDELEEVLADATESTAGSTVLNTFPIDPEGMTQLHDFHPPSLFFELSPQSSPQDLEDEVIDWSRTPSPALDSQPVFVAAQDQEWDAAFEMDAQVEEGEFARFISQVKGKNIDDVRKEIDDEINDLNRQRRAAMRDSEDVTQQMITQIMVGFLFPSLF
jgi:DNA excision repair protein ERCC-5